MSDTPQGDGWWVATDGRWYAPESHPDFQPTQLLPAVVPVAAAPTQPTDEVLFTVGDIGVSRYWVITPSGTVPIAGTQWILKDNTRIERSMPGYAVVLAVLFFLACFLGLLFLAIREDRLTGSMEIHVRGPDGFYHLTQVPVWKYDQVHQIGQAVNNARQLAQQR